MALYRHLRDLFSLKPDLVLSDRTSPDFEDAGPLDFAQHGYRRDGTPQKVPVIVGVVMVAGGPLAHHLWAGHTGDRSTGPEVISDLRTRFGRLVFVGDRGMVSEEKLESITKEKQGFLVGLKRRRHAQRDDWLDAVDEPKWLNCASGLKALEPKTAPPGPRAQEVPCGIPEVRVSVIDSEERRASEPAKREPARAGARQKLEKLKERVDSGALKQPEKIGAALARVMQRYHGYRYFEGKLGDGTIEVSESKTHFEREQGIEGKDVIATSEKALRVPDAVARSKELSEVETGFRQLKEVMARRPISPQIETGVNPPSFVAALGLLLEGPVHRRWEEAGVDQSPARARQAWSRVRGVRFRIEDQPARRGVSGGGPEARRVLKTLKLVELRPPEPLDGEETVR